MTDDARGDDGPEKISLKTEFILGVRGSIQSNVEFGSDTNLIFPTAHHVGMYNMDRKSMEFFHPTRGIRCVHSMCLSLNKELLVVCEQASARFSKNISDQLGVNPNQISIYKTHSRAKLKSIPSQSHAPILSVAFSADNKCLATLEDAPTYRIAYWKWSTAKLVAHAPCPSRGTRIRFNPFNSNFLTISGPMVLRAWSLTTTMDLRMSNLIPQIREQEHFVDHVWVRQYLVTISELGTLLIFQGSDDKDGVELVHSTKLSQLQSTFQVGKVQTICASSKGFVLAGTSGLFSVFEFSDDPKDPFILIRSMAAGDFSIESVAISPNCENAVAYTDTQRLVTFSMASIDVVQDGAAEFRDLIPNGSHSGPILTIDVCIQKPILVTCGVDKTIRSWNYNLCTYEVVASLTEEPTTLSLHPAGFQLVVAFKERVRIYNLIQEGLRVLRDFSMKACTVIRFSHGGHQFACGAGLTVSIFRTYTCELTFSLTGHINTIQSLTWSYDDLLLYSAGNDGTIYCWNTTNGNRCDDMQLVVKHCKITSVVTDCSSSKFVVMAGSDGHLREVVSGEETKNIDLGVPLSSMALTKSNRWLFVGTRTGSIFVFSWPLTSQASPTQDMSVHSEPITQLRLTDDDRILASSSEDGCMCIFRVEENTAILPDDQSHRKSPQILTDAVLVSREEIEDKNEQLSDIMQKYEQVKSDMEFSLHSKENEWIDRIRVLKDECEHSLVQERIRYEELEQRYQNALRKHNEEFTQKESNHAKFSQELENRYEHKLAMEISRYDRLSEEMELARQQCAALIDAQEKQQRAVLDGERRAANARAKEQVELIKRVKDDLSYNHVKFEEILSQQEEDYEFQIQKLRADYEEQLVAERQNTAIKETQITGKNSKIDSLKKKIQELKANASARDILLSTERAKTTKLEAALAKYEKYFDSLQKNIDEKEKSVQTLKSTNHVLESFRFVLDNRVEELQNEKAPMQKLIGGLESHIHDVQDEMVEEFHQKDVMEETLASKDIKIRALTNEVNTLRLQTRKKESTIGAMTREFARIVLISNPKELERAVKDAYIVYVKGEAPKSKKYQTTSVINSSPIKLGSNDSTAVLEAHLISNDNREVVQETCKQLQYMHRSVATLKNALQHAKSEAEHHHRDAITEGNILLQDMNQLRKKNKTLELKVKELESALYLAESAKKKRMKARADTPTKLSPLTKSSSVATLASPGRLVVGSVLPFATIEKERELNKVTSSSSVKEYQNKIDQQQREIQRLRTQVQLLLEQEAERNDTSDAIAVIPLEPYPQPPVALPQTTPCQTIHSISRKTEPSFHQLFMRPQANGI
ncbi:WD domain-containing protein [Thraustotheca clavata]|uniref:WD domain-containing protein n=1 Tax=Thraustotheca clavata TaxID=74557 RepID=A0A1V9YWA4_9STRA|nr:WD domain-containing protein [Thraustotheca clavata]